MKNFGKQLGISILSIVATAGIVWLLAGDSNSLEYGIMVLLFSPVIYLIVRSVIAKKLLTETTKTAVLRSLLSLVILVVVFAVGSFIFQLGLFSWREAHRQGPTLDEQWDQVLEQRGQKEEVDLKDVNWLEDN